MNQNTSPVALVTGSSRGLGRGIAVKLASEGFSVAVNYAGNLEAANETVALCKKAASSPAQKFFSIQADVGSTADRKRLVEETFAHFGRLDALVNNAGIAPKERADIVDASEESFEHLISTNLQGPYFLTQQVVKRWLAEKKASELSGGFKIIFVSSISAYTASLNRGDYCISKAGLAMAVQLWASRLANEGVQVFEVRPGIMATDMTSGVKEKYDRLIGEGLVPMKRWGSGDDVGLAVLSILKGHFPFSTGEVLNVDGGFHMKRL
ncbi:MAG: 3-ketoacyl-ACP reductase [Spirochaetia bacterium]|nr:3-ketoacyl-ACP reductase [Spirochaetia bacterium]